jgi:hypothetical protein
MTTETILLYFTDSKYDDTDPWFSKDRCLKFSTENQATFDFMIEVSK